ncbi:MAG TPA: fumarate hydratase [Rectinemataceae bacterium]|nr:fumarate hydratase [Rectinemataceae bacterium]
MQPDITEKVLELIRRTSTDIPPDVEASLRKAIGDEAPGSAAQGALETILSNIELSRKNGTPICQDTGTPIFRVRHPEGWSTRKMGEQIRAALVQATKLSYMRPNAVDSLTDKNSGNNLGGEEFPTIHFEESATLAEALPSKEASGEPTGAQDWVVVELMLKGGGCENVGAQYSLPDESIGAGRDLAGVRKCVLDAVQKAQGLGCAPGILGVSVGGDRGSGYVASKAALYTPIGTRNTDPEVAKMEERLTKEANSMGIGPMGFGGKTTVIDTKIVGMHRLPASYFVTISYMCWAYRRRRMILAGDRVEYK